MTPEEAGRLEELDRTHWLHPLGDLDAPSDLVPSLIFESGQGATLTDVHGRVFIDAMASLWNVNVGHGRRDLADAAAEQMARLAFSSAYGAFSHRPAIELSARLAELAPGELEVTYFASGGAEANDTAYKLARLHAKLSGQPDRVKIVSRIRDYHGTTYGATSATGIASFWKNYEPLAQDFLHAASPDPYRAPDRATAGRHYISQLEGLLQEVGPETVAAVVAEPVQGAGGLIIPPSDYFPLLRKLCDRHGILLIADEVITGFGRTGRWFALEHWGVAPDLMIFAKGVTSGYLPLSGVMLSRSVHDRLRSLRGVLNHGQTYSGHPAACAVALRNLEILGEERLVERVAELGPILVAKLERLNRHSIVGDIRGLGLLAGVELVSDRETKAAFDPGAGIARRVSMKALEEGVIVRALGGDVIAMSPPFVISEAELERVVQVVDLAIAEVQEELGIPTG